MDWNQLNAIDQLKQIDAESKSELVLLFKHSIKCGTSSSALNRIERNWKPTDYSLFKPYYLNILMHRNISNEIENHYGVEHQSPQLLVIQNGKCIYSISHSAIRYDDLMEEVFKQYSILK